MNKFTVFENRIAKLLNTYKNYGNIVIGVDFDYTLVESDEDHRLHTDLVKLLKTAQSLGCILCVWTANPREELVRKKWLEADLTIDHYNKSPLVFNGVKPHFNVLLDDTAGLKEATAQLAVFLDQVGEL